MHRWLAIILFALPVPVRGDDSVIFFPTLGRRVQAGSEWELDIHGWVFEPERRALLLPVFRRALGFDDDEMTAGEKQIFAERARWFLVDNQRGRRLHVQINGKDYELPKSAPDGHVTAHIRVPAGPVEFSGGAVHLLDETGLSVISDIDDTIKISEVRNRRNLLRRTFVQPFEPVPGMAELYRSWPKATFHYVSASPWHLYPALAEFIRANHFPAGTFHLKAFRWKDKRFFDLFDSPEKYKLSVIEPLLKQFPKRHFILIGDSVEKDPETYGRLAREHPDQIIRILIRDVTGEAADSARYRQAFAEVPAEHWTLWHQP